jgi:hypothetical protein
MQVHDPELIKWLRFFCSHLVALCVTFSKKGAPETTWFKSFSGTLLRVGERAYFLTAGHILRNLYEGIENGVQIHGSLLVDSFGPNPVSHEPFPFDLPNEPHFYIDEPEQGLDFGVISLRKYYIRLLEANRLAFIDEQNFRAVPAEFDAYFMLGFPQELSSEKVSESGTAKFEPVMISIQKKEALPEDTTSSLNPQFVGKIDPDFLETIHGMSGGPIVGYKKGPSDRYWIIALQSAWFRNRREVVGCPLNVLFSFLADHQIGG